MAHSYDVAQEVIGSPQLDCHLRLRSRSELPNDMLDDQLPSQEIESSLALRFEKVARRAPDSLAVISSHAQLTYRQLNNASNALAIRLLQIPDLSAKPIVVFSHQGPECCIGMLAVLKSGTAIVPLDPVYGDERLQMILEDTGVEVIVSSADTAERARAISSGRKVVEIDCSDQSPDFPAVASPISPDSAAFIVFTSGSTGRPKGIIRSHRAQLHIARQFAQLFGVGPGERWSGLHSPAWTSGITDAFTALSNGAALCSWSPLRDGLGNLAQWLNNTQVTIISWTPSAMRALIATSPRNLQLTTTRLICLGSERLYSRDACEIMKFAPPSCIFVNRLGSSEAGNFRYFFFDRDTRFEVATVPPGYTAPDGQMRLLDETGSETPAGQVGEIVVRSDYLASGYWRQPELTKQRFRIFDGMREFFTGDLGKLGPDGCLEYMGRKDSQIKIRGYRVEPEEVEQVLRQCNGVRDAAVIARDAASANPWLAAYFVGDGSLDQTTEIRKELAKRLPTYLVPRVLIRLDSLPRNPNHKIDPSLLPDVFAGQSDIRPLRDAQTKLEEFLTSVWEEILDTSPIGVCDDFFLLGGDSLKAMRMIARLRLILDEPPTVMRLFDFPTIHEFAGILQQQDPDITQRLADFLVAQ